MKSEKEIYESIEADLKKNMLITLSEPYRWGHYGIFDNIEDINECIEENELDIEEICVDSDYLNNREVK